MRNNAALLDIASIGTAGYSNRNRIPAGYPGAPQAPASGPSGGGSGTPPQ